VEGACVAVPFRVIASSMAPGRSGSALGARIGARSHDASAISPTCLCTDSAVCAKKNREFWTHIRKCTGYLHENV